MLESKKNEANATHINNITVDELAFVLAYFAENMNSTRAYMRLHPKAKYDSARATAPEWLAKPSVQIEIKRRLEENAMGAAEALYRLGEMARAEMRPFIRISDDGFCYFNFSDPESSRYMYLIKKIKTKRERRIDGGGKDSEAWEGEWVEVELHDAQAALRDILKIHGKFVDRFEFPKEIHVTLKTDE